MEIKIVNDKYGLANKCKTLISKMNIDFPELKNEKIKIIIEKIGASAMTKPSIFGGHLLYVHPEKYSSANNIMLTGMLAHELIHMEQSMAVTFPKHFANSLKYYFFKKYKREIEITTDIDVIKRGYRNQLFECRKFREKHYSEKEAINAKMFYLSSKEIKNYKLTS